MKMLLHTTKEVKLLREKGVLYSVLTNDDGVVRLFQDTDTYGISFQIDIYKVKMRIEKHCNDRAKMWLA